MPNTTRVWTRLDTAGTDLAFVTDDNGLRARGAVVAADPFPHVCRYELTTDPNWATTSLEVVTEGDGWSRRVRLRRDGTEWRVTTSEQGNLMRVLKAAKRRPVGLPGMEDPSRLTGVLDVDVGAAPLFNTLPVRRLGLQEAPEGTSHRIQVAWVLVPSLEVAAVEQTYTALGPDRVRYTSDRFTAELELDPQGFVTHYPGLARLA
jgi:hypothetical protein